MMLLGRINYMEKKHHCFRIWSPSVNFCHGDVAADTPVKETSLDCYSCISTHYVIVSILIKLSLKTCVFILIIIKLHKIICRGCVLESPRRGDSNTLPQHMILWRNIENFPFLSF